MEREGETKPGTGAGTEKRAKPSRISLAIDPFAPSSVVDMVATDRIIRDAGPIVWLDQYGMWASARYDTVKAVLDDPQNFSSAKRPFNDPDFPIPEILVTDDPPTHGPLRKAISKILTPSTARTRTDFFREVAKSVVTDVCDRGSFDAVNDLAVPYILRVFGDVIGLQSDGREHLVPFGNAVLNGFGPANEIFRSTTAEAVDAKEWVLAQCMSGEFSLGSVGAAIFEAARRGEYSEELAGLLVLNLVSAGVDTTVALISNMIHAFTEFPEQWAALTKNRQLAAGAFEETHRWRSPSRMLGRVAHNDVQIGDAAIKAGQSILLFAGATGRDEAVWGSPDLFDITRTPGKQLSFGFGIHFCLGHMLARAEVLALIEALSERVSSFETDGEPTPLNSTVVQAFSRLPVRVSE